MQDSGDLATAANHKLDHPCIRFRTDPHRRRAIADVRLAGNSRRPRPTGIFRDARNEERPKLPPLRSLAGSGRGHDMSARAQTSSGMQRPPEATNSTARRRAPRRQAALLQLRVYGRRKEASSSPRGARRRPRSLRGRTGSSLPETRKKASAAATTAPSTLETPSFTLRCKNGSRERSGSRGRTRDQQR